MTDSLSPRLPRGRLLRTTLLLTSGTVAVVVLAGCGAGSTPGSSPTAKSPSSASPSTPATNGDAAQTPEAAATSTPTPEAPEAEGTPVALTCDQVLTLDDVYAFNPNYGSAPDFEPTLAAGQKAADFEGLNCGLLNQSSGGLIEVSVAQPNDVLRSQLQNEAASSGQIVPTYGTPPDVEGYFSASGGTGVAQAFTPTYWITIGSPEFFEPGDAEALISAAISNLQ